MRRSSTHLIVPCLVTVPDLNVTLHVVCSRPALASGCSGPPPAALRRPSHSVSVVSPQVPMPLDRRGVTWDNKRGWSIPRWAIDSSPPISIYCLATLGGKQFQSAVYLIHVTGNAGRKGRSEFIWFKSFVYRGSPRGVSHDLLIRGELATYSA